MRPALALLLFTACASTPAAPQAAAPAGDPVRLVLRPVRAQPQHRALAADIDAQICSVATQVAGFDVICAADIQAAAEVGHLREAFGGCDGPEDDCVGQVQALATGEEALTVELTGSDAGFELAFQRAAAGGEVLGQARRAAATPGDLQAQVGAAVTEVLQAAPK